MDLAGYVISAVLVESRSVSEVAAAHGVSRSWLYELLARYREAGEEGLRPLSKRPRRSPTRVSPDVEDELPGHATPAAAYHTRPKATPTSRHSDTHWRVRHDTVDTNGTVTLRHNGRLHHIGIGRTHTRTPILLLIADLDIRIIHATTGEMLRHLTLDPTRNYQPTHRPPGPPPRKPQQPDP